MLGKLPEMDASLSTVHSEDRAKPTSKFQYGNDVSASFRRVGGAVACEASGAVPANDGAGVIVANDE
jgi:hypothetical protein